MVRKIALLLAVAVTGCSSVDQVADSIQLKRGLEGRYHGTEVSVTWVDGLSHLKVTLDGPSFREISDESVRDRAEEIARESIRYFTAERPPESITIEFVQERSGGVVRMTRSVSISFTPSEFAES